MVTVLELLNIQVISDRLTDSEFSPDEWLTGNKTVKSLRISRLRVTCWGPSRYWVSLLEAIYQTSHLV